MPGVTVNGSRNDPLRGCKRTTLEGGIRVPFVVSWPGTLKPGVFEQPVIQLDLHATALAAAGVEAKPEWKLDGVNLLPFLTGEKSGAPHDALYWRFGEQMAIRMGDYKLVRYDSNADTRTGGASSPSPPRSSTTSPSDIGEDKDLAAADAGQGEGTSGEVGRVEQAEHRSGWERRRQRRRRARHAREEEAQKGGGSALKRKLQCSSPRPCVPSQTACRSSAGRWLAAYFPRCFLGLVLGTSSFAASPPAKPNIVVIVADDLGYADVLFNPQHPKEVTTPHLDALAKQSVICRQGYVSGHVCSPTRAGLMTGRYQQRLGLYTGGEAGSGLPMSEKIFPQYLKPAGYATAQFGKWHLGPDAGVESGAARLR